MHEQQSRVYTRAQFTHSNAHTIAHTRTNVHVRSYTHTHTHKHLHTCTHINTCTHAHTNTCTHTHTHTHTNTHTHTHVIFEPIFINFVFGHVLSSSLSHLEAIWGCQHLNLESTHRYFFTLLTKKWSLRRAWAVLVMLRSVPPVILAPVPVMLRRVSFVLSAHCY